MSTPDTLAVLASQQFNSLVVDAAGITNEQSGADFGARLRLMDELELKKVGHYGLGQFIKQIGPRLPFIDDPASPACLQTLQETYVARIAGKVNARTPSILSDAYSMVHDMVGQPVNIGLENIADVEIIVQRTLAAELLVRRLMVGAPVVTPGDFTVTTARGGIGNTIRDSMFGVARMQLDSLGERTTGMKSYDQTADEYLEIAPHIRRLLELAPVKRMLHKQAGYEKSRLEYAYHTGKLTSWLDIDTGAVTPQEPPISPTVSCPFDTTKTVESLEVGCPARYAKNMIDWAPQLLLTACQAVATVRQMSYNTGG